MSAYVRGDLLFALGLVKFHDKFIQEVFVK